MVNNQHINIKILNNKYTIIFLKNLGTGCSTAFIRVFAALGLATDLQTVTSNAVKAGLTKSVETGRPVVECLTETAKEDIARMPHDHFLKPNI